MASTAENVLARVKRLLAEKEAKLASYVAVKVARGDGVSTVESIRMTRRWEKIDDLIREDLEDYLRTYASVSNGDVAGVYVTDPWADGEIRSGRWRMLRVFSSPLKTNPAEQGIFQTLMYWPEGYGDFGDYCAESSPLHHEDAEVFVDSPEMADCAHANSPGFVYTASNRFDPETGLWSGELRTDEARPYEAPATYSVSASESVKEEVAENQTAAKKPTSAEVAGAVVRSSIGINRHGRFNTTISTETGKATQDDGKIESAESSETTTAKTYQTTKETAAATDGQIVRVQNKQSKYPGRWETVRTVETGKPLVTTEKTVAGSYEETTTSTQTASAELPAPVKETSFIKTVRNEQSKYPSRWNVLERIRRILHIPSAVKYDNRDDAAAHGQTEESIGVPNTSGVAVVLSADAGTAVRAQVRYDKESDTLDVSKDVTTAKEQVTTEITEARSYRETTTQKTAQAAALPDPVEESGFIKTVRNEASDYANRYNTTERIREIKRIDEAVEYDHADDASVHGRTVERLGQPNSGLAVTLAAGAGEALSASVRYDKESDTLDVEEKTLTVKPQESTRKVEAAGFSETTTEKTAQASAAPAPTAVDGHIKTARTVASRFEGKYDTEETDREVKPLDATASGGSPLWDVSEEVHANASADMSGQAAGGVGVVVESSSRKNDAGRFDNQKRTRTAKPFGPKSDAHGTPLVDETTEYYRNQDSFPSPGTPAVGTMIDVSGSINEAGKIDYQKTTRTAKLTTITDVSTGFNEFFDEKTDIHLNADGVAVSRASGEVVDASVTLNEFGKQNVSIRKSTAKKVVSGPFTEHDDGYKKITKTIHRNVDSVPTVAYDDNGHDISVQVNEHGKKDVVETETTVRAFDIDIEEPTSYNEAKGFQRICYGLRGSNEIQPKVAAFMAKVSSQPNSRYRVTASVDRDENGFYKLTLNANPKDSNGGGGSAQDWDNGIDYTVPDCLKTNPYDYEAAKITYCSNRIKARDLLEAAPPKGERIAHGAGGVTGIQLLGRGRYKVTVCYGFS